MLGLGFVGGQLAVLQLPNLSDVSLAIRSSQHTAILMKASGIMWPCSLELLSGVEAA